MSALEKGSSLLLTLSPIAISTIIFSLSPIDLFLISRSISFPPPQIKTPSSFSKNGALSERFKGTTPFRWVPLFAAPRQIQDSEQSRGTHGRPFRIKAVASALNGIWKAKGSQRKSWGGNSQLLAGL